MSILFFLQQRKELKSEYFLKTGYFLLKSIHNKGKQQDYHNQNGNQGPFHSIL
jgi:hypothetical protein